MKITLHSKDGCPYCSMAKAWFAEHNVEIDEIKWNNDGKRRQLYSELSQKYGQKVATVPQIEVEEEGGTTLTNGYTALKTSELAQRLATGFHDVDF